MAALRTSGVTSRATNGAKLDSAVRLFTSSSESDGAGSSGEAGSCATGRPTTGSGWTTGGAGSATALPARTACLRCDQRPKKPSVITSTCLLYTSDAADDLLCVDL